MRMSCRPLAAALAIIVLAACGSSKATSGANATTTAAPGASTTVAAGGDTPTTTALVQKFVYQPEGFCAAFSNYLLYVGIAAAPFASGFTDSSSTTDPAADAKAGAAALAFAPAIAPTTDVLRSDAPEEVLPVFRDFDAYNDEAVKALGALGVDTDKFGPTVAAELAKVDLTAPGDLPTTESVAVAGGIDSSQLTAAGASFVKDHGTLEAVFEKYSQLPDPTTERQRELITKYPCLATALATGG
jgi:hypothetical protein